MKGRSSKRDKSNIKNVVFERDVLTFLDEVIVPHVGENRSAVVNAIVRQVWKHYQQEGELPIVPVDRKIRFSGPLFSSSAS